MSDCWLVALGRGLLAREDLGTLTGIFSVCRALLLLFMTTCPPICLRLSDDELCPGLRSRILVWEVGGPKWGADSIDLCGIRKSVFGGSCYMRAYIPHALSGSGSTRMANMCGKITSSSHANNVKSPNSSKSRVIYLVSGYEERVGEVFESRVTRLNAWKGARVQGMHVRVRMGAREDVRRASKRGSARRACASWRFGWLTAGTVHPRVTILHPRCTK
ncbi:hypothetical protein CRG98_006466 [Punica granatum]|uniref:Uncharacterized protein n=1 Tax=Punica granatum TaxID=22663 RepID=A0A2I0KXD0_PUNGR|nr:hypothetical protein CRG98_006466 [Punica granatum]